ncbi:sigma-B regulation protein RsbU (phosphoserine phosphatase) [Neobacillus bataviensis]|uniref:Sigma-B regulation protein RsbU (Phosphoserine phosphatase) n=1 Tax=Neobacillus bataviensis TaxID=220685 RepID=A0A561D8L9_9BACI|nr:fused response regulator/phosphatase [Neobacillus bataviensis]TWD99428.1 sigma-B regulation protein RsbU (phosphoserine phosphatase) [Neobacillus bataviensis]
MNIVIVDDNITNLMIIEKILQKAGYDQLVLLSSARELYDYLKLDASSPVEIPVDLILMDLMMPEIDGLEACRTILANERYEDLPIIIVTAMGDSYKMAEAMDAGALDYVMKPINKVELLARIRSVLRLKYEKDLRKERDRRIQHELDLAKQVQLSMLSDPIVQGDVTISAVYKPSFELAGDLYAWYQISPGRYGVILLDMMGHGISSSLVCMYIYSTLKDAITGLGDPEAVMMELNRRMNQLHMPDRLENYYFTAIYFVLDTAEQTIEYVNAGHPAGIAIVDDEVKLMANGCCPLGFFEDIAVTKGVIPYKKGARILLFTDGLSEGLEEEYEDAISKLVSSLQEQGMDDPKELFERLQLSSEMLQDAKDDMCLVIVSTNRV